jgi:hypothetical protein
MTVIINNDDDDDDRVMMIVNGDNGPNFLFRRLKTFLDFARFLFIEIRNQPIQSCCGSPNSRIINVLFKKEERKTLALL